jgi:DnaJ-class molecular chaperone
MKKCPVCNGSGLERRLIGGIHRTSFITCSVCNGKGKVSEKKWADWAESRYAEDWLSNRRVIDVR